MKWYIVVVNYLNYNNCYNYIIVITIYLFHNCHSWGGGVGKFLSERGDKETSGGVYNRGGYYFFITHSEFVNVNGN